MLNESNMGEMKRVIKAQDRMQKLIYRLAHGRKYVSKGQFCFPFFPLLILI